MGKKYVVTGGAGFIGTNYVARLLKRNEDVTVFDNLSRRGVPVNLEWLQETHGKDSFKFIQGDVRDAAAVRSAVASADVIVHLAAQVAVTTSVENPREDFEINALGTLNVLEGARLGGRTPSMIYTSTNKVFGALEDLEIVEDARRYRFKNHPHGVSEEQPLDFHSPYGCSKGTGDQYVRDYARIYKFPTTVLRLSCIYGPHQFGIEDQGWVAWLAIAALSGKQISIYGDGKQVRDLLFIEDLMNLFDHVISNPQKAGGQIFNAGGGTENSIAVWSEFGPMLEKYLSRKIPVQYGAWRAGDQKVFIADSRKAQRVFGWQPKTNIEAGVKQLSEWVLAHEALFKKLAI